MELFTVKRYKNDVQKHREKNEVYIYQKLLHKVKNQKIKLIADSTEECKEEKILEKIEKLPNNKVVESDTSNSAVTIPPECDVNCVSTKRDNTKVFSNWLAHPTIISTKFANLKNGIPTKDPVSDLTFLTPVTKDALRNLGVTHLFPVQLTLIPWLLEAHLKSAPFRPRDICVSSPTGSGKTLAYAIPIVQLLSNRVQCNIRALIVLPVVELALQVFRIFKSLCKNTVVKVCLLSKQLPFALEQEKLVEFYNGNYHAKADIVISTPGRLVAHLHSTRGINLRMLQFLVIDEADRIVDAAFQNWFYHLTLSFSSSSDQQASNFVCFNDLQRTLGCEPHKLLFSATLSHDPEKLKHMKLFQPKLFTSVSYIPNSSNEVKTEANQDLLNFEFLGKYVTPSELTEKFCITESRLKPLTLYSLIKDNNWKKFVCFTNNAESATRLAFVLSKMLAKSLNIAELSRALDTKSRTTVISKFSRGAIHGLICSDALARGIDFPNVDIVVSYDPPRHIKTYIHRIGRTARAGKPGVAVTLLTLAEAKHFNKLLAEVDKAVTEEIIVPSRIEEENAQIYSIALKELRGKIAKNKRVKVLLKERMRGISNITNKPSTETTTMEKLQLQATIKANEIIQNKTKGSN